MEKNQATSNNLVFLNYFELQNIILIRIKTQKIW